MERDTSPKVIAKESVLMKVMMSFPLIKIQMCFVDLVPIVIKKNIFIKIEFIKYYNNLYVKQCLVMGQVCTIYYMILNSVTVTNFIRY